MIKVIGYVNCTMDMVYFVTKEENIVEKGEVYCSDSP